MGDINCDLVIKEISEPNTKELKFNANLYQYNQLIKEATKVTSSMH